MLQTLDSKYGAFFGGIIGDCIGTKMDLLNMQLRIGRGPSSARGFNGTWGDDTSLLLCTIFSKRRETFSNQEFVSNMNKWFHNGKYAPDGVCNDIKPSTVSALQGVKSSLNDCSYLARLLPIILEGGEGEAIDGNILSTHQKTEKVQRDVDEWMHMMVGELGVGRTRGAGGAGVEPSEELRIVQETLNKDIDFEEGLHRIANISVKTKFDRSIACTLFGQIMGGKIGIMGIKRDLITRLKKLELLLSAADYAFRGIKETEDEESYMGTAQAIEEVEIDEAGFNDELDGVELDGVELDAMEPDAVLDEASAQ